MWLSKSWYVIFLIPALLNYASAEREDEEDESSGSGLSSGGQEEEEKELLPNRNEKDDGENDISTHIKRENHVAAVKGVKREKQPKLPEAMSPENTIRWKASERRNVAAGETKNKKGRSKSRSNIPYPDFETRSDEIPGIIQVLPAELNEDFDNPIQVPSIPSPQRRSFYRKDYMNPGPKVVQRKEKAEDSLPYNSEHETHLAPDVSERYEHTSDEARHAIGKNTSQSQHTIIRSKLHHGVQTNSGQLSPSKKEQQNRITVSRSSLDSHVHRTSLSPILGLKSPNTDRFNQPPSKAMQRSVVKSGRNFHKELTSPPVASNRRTVKTSQSSLGTHNQFFAKPQKAIKKEIDFGGPSVLKVNRKAALVKPSDEDKKFGHERKHLVSRVNLNKGKQRNRTSFKRFQDASTNPVGGLFSKIFADTLTSLPLETQNNESPEPPFFPLSLGKVPQEVTVSTSESSPADITPAAAATPSEESPIITLPPNKPKDESDSTAEITLTTQPNDQLLSELKGIEARVGVLEVAVNQIRESVDSLKKNSEQKEAAPITPSEAEGHEMSLSHPLVQEMIIEAIKKPTAEEPKEPLPMLPEEDGNFPGVPLEKTGDSPDLSPLPQGKPHELKEIFIPLPPRHSGAETEIEEGAPLPGLPFPVNYMVSKVLKKMLKAREEKERDGPEASLTPSPDSDAPPTEHDIGQLENEIGPPFEQIFSPEGSEPIAPLNSEEDSLDRPKGHAVMEITLAKAGKEPEGCECINGGRCIEGSCSCPPLFSGPRCESFSLFKKLQPIKQVALDDNSDSQPIESSLEISKPLESDNLPNGPQKFDPSKLLNMVTGFVRQLQRNKRRHALFKRSLRSKSKPIAKRYTKFVPRK